ncbi:hypothetical protein J4219_08290 [Candidatus Woesearchaeota archaeon]|nr:hypothetical protein [Candidatus Woesearchaeota archaeon]
MKLPKWTNKVEIFVEKAIPYLLILLTVIIVLELTHYGEMFHIPIVIADAVIVTFFVTDLVFKWFHTKSTYKFVKMYWIELIAVFPFYLFSRVLLFASEFTAASEGVQKLLHESALLREVKFLQEVELFKEVEYGPKLSRWSRFVRTFARGLRLLRARFYFVHGHMKHSRRDDIR